SSLLRWGEQRRGQASRKAGLAHSSAQCRHRGTDSRCSHVCLWRKDYLVKVRRSYNRKQSCVTTVGLSLLEAATGLAGRRHPGGSSPKKEKGMPTRKPAVLFVVLAALLLAVLAACGGSQAQGAPKTNASSGGASTAAPSAIGDAAAASPTPLS